MQDNKISQELSGCTAVLGGSFDPIHLGHLHIAAQILRTSFVKEVLFVPSDRHNFKRDSLILDYNTRCRLVKAAIQNEPRFAFSDADQGSQGYSAELMQKLSSEHPGTPFVFVIGSDNLPGLKKWNNAEWLQANVKFLVLPRPGHEITENDLAGWKTVILPISLSPISATGIRQRIARGESIHNMVPEFLEAEIVQLYK